MNNTPLEKLLTSANPVDLFDAYQNIAKDKTTLQEAMSMGLIAKLLEIFKARLAKANPEQFLQLGTKLNDAVGPFDWGMIEFALPYVEKCVIAAKPRTHVKTPTAADALIEKISGSMPLNSRFSSFINRCMAAGAFHTADKEMEEAYQAFPSQFDATTDPKIPLHLRKSPTFEAELKSRRETIDLGMSHIDRCINAGAYDIAKNIINRASNFWPMERPEKRQVGDKALSLVDRAVQAGAIGAANSFIRTAYYSYPKSSLQQDQMYKKQAELAKFCMARKNWSAARGVIAGMVDARGTDTTECKAVTQMFKSLMPQTKTGLGVVPVRNLNAIADAELQRIKMQQGQGGMKGI